jgi:hypothetical protein
MKRTWLGLVTVSSLMLVVSTALGQQLVSDELRVSTYTNTGHYHPSVSSDAAGNFMVCWYNFDGGDYGIFGQRFDAAGSRLGSEFRVETNSAASVWFPSVAMAPSGAFVVVWTEAEGQWPIEMVGRRYDPTGSPAGPEYLIAGDTTAGAATAGVASDQDGNFVVLWDAFDEPNTSSSVFGRRFAADGSPRGSEFRVNASTTQKAFARGLAANPAGDFLVLWGTEDGAAWARPYSAAGSPTAHEVLVSSRSDSVSAAMDGAGAFVVVWSEHLISENFAGPLRARRYDAGGIPVSEWRITDQSDPFEPAVAIDPAGGFAISWVAFDDITTNRTILVRRASPELTSVGPELQVNEPRFGYKRNPRIVPLGGGRFVIAYESDGIDGGGFVSIAARLYAFAKNGDANADGAVDVADVFYLIGELFAGGPASIGPPDANGDGSVDVLDVFYLINYLFAGGPAPVG